MDANAPHEAWRGIPSDRVVAVVAHLSNHKIQIGSGYLIDSTHVLTAAHCTYDKLTKTRALSLTVYRQSDGSKAQAHGRKMTRRPDVAVLTLGTRLGDATMPYPRYGRVNRTWAQELVGCEAVGYPLFQYDDTESRRNSAHVKGIIRTTDGAESDYLLLRDQLLEAVTALPAGNADSQDVSSPWGGMSGAVVFYRGLALGVVVQHHPRQGTASIRLAPFSTLATAKERQARAIAASINLPPLDDLPLATPDAVDEILAASLNTSTPNQLPADDVDLMGREDVFNQIVSLLEPTTSPKALTSSTVVLSGSPGVGKTALAVHIAHTLAPDYPDGQLYARLRGADARSLSADAVIADFLRALGVAGSAIPDGLAERAELFQSRLRDRRVLVVLDDAGSEQQVRPLIPRAPTCAVVITSRKHLPSLQGVQRMRLEALRSADALEVLRSCITDDRVTAEEPAATQVARLCGYLPLALQIVGARLALRPGLRVSKLAERLRDENSRLNELQVGDVAVRAAIAISYVELSPQAKMTFRRLGLIEAADFTAWRLAALLDITIAEADRQIETLLVAGMAESLGTDAVEEERFWMHDLIRLYARECIEADEPADERLEAVRRAIESFAFLASLAASSLEPGEHYDNAAMQQSRRHVDDPDLLKVIELAPMDWFSTERRNLIIAIDRAATAGLHVTVIDLMRLLATFLDYDAQWDDWQQSATLALASARAISDCYAEASVLRSLGRLQRYRGDWDRAAALNAESLAISRATRDEVAEAETLVDSIRLSWYRGQYAEAHDAYGRATSLFVRHDHVYGQARCRASIGLVLRDEGQPVAAIRHCQMALTQFRIIGDVRWTAAALTALADTYLAQKNYLDAERCATEALPLLQSIGFRWWEAVTLRTLGQIYVGLRRYDDADLCLGQSVDVLHELGMRWWEAVAKLSVAELRCVQGRYQDAIRDVTSGIETFRHHHDDKWVAFATVLGAQIALNEDPTRLDFSDLNEATAVLRASQDATLRARALELITSIHRLKGDEVSAEHLADQCNSERQPSQMPTPEVALPHPMTSKEGIVASLAELHDPAALDQCAGDFPPGPQL
jgi:tetratricopeptide (TPR) repeat protein